MRSFLTIASMALTFTGLAQASPLKVRQTPDRFYLETQVVAGANDCGSNKGGLYLYSYHTGAGQGVATASAGAPSSYFYLNDTQLLWTYPDNEIGPWPVVIDYVPYAAFNPISISIASDATSSGFSVNASGLQNTAASGFIACDWYYTAPQIFALSGYVDFPLPKSCSQVTLAAVPAA